MKTKYEKTVEQLIDKMEIAIEQCLSIIEQDITPGISEDKMHNVLRGKRQATEDAIFYAKEIDKFERDLANDGNITIKDEKKEKIRGPERFARE